MLDELRDFKKGLLNLEVGDIIWEQEQKEWFLVLEIEPGNDLTNQIVTALIISNNEKVYFPVGENYYCFKEGGKVVKGSTPV